MAKADLTSLPDFSLFLDRMVWIEQDWRAGKITFEQWDAESRKEIENYHNSHPEKSRFDLALAVIAEVRSL